MKITHIPFQKTGYFSKTILDYLEEKLNIQPFYNNFPNLEGFKKQITEKINSEFTSKLNRKTLVNVLKNQYKNVKISKSTQQNINLLLQENTFTITTGHQLNLFTGPLYFLYKIISTINLCEELNKKFPNENFVPIYWMAAEDHDFEEVNFFNFQEKKVQWNTNENGAVGRFSTDGLQTIFEEFLKHLSTSKNSEYLKQLFFEGYLKNNNLSQATQYIANELFEKYGLIIIDADTTDLKQLFIPFIEDELLNKTSYKTVSKTILTLKKEYKIQVNPREINLFYLTNESRERILFKNDVYKVNNTDIIWSSSEIQKHLYEKPERFSPNVVMRPLYQEVILPNLCYIGGGGELAYWLELKEYFAEVNIPFPILLLRNSVQIISEKQQKKLNKLTISIDEIFLKQNDLIIKKIKENSKNLIDFSSQKQFLKQQFSQLKEIAKQTDVSFIGAVNAQEKKQLKGLENLEKRLLRAEKRNQKELVYKIIEIQNQLFPNQSLEERQRNFSDYYLEYGADFISTLKNVLNPLKLEFIVLEL